MRFTQLLTAGALLLSNFLFAQNGDDVLLTIEDKQITVEEFMMIYKKNNKNKATASDSSDQSGVKEYMDLYVNFKLKVHEAEQQGMDTVPTFTKELDGYVNQLAKPYLSDTMFTEVLIKEAYERMKWEINAKHIMVQVAEDATPEDTLNAWDEIHRIYKVATAGDSNFSDLAVKYSDDPSAVKNGGDLGYFSAFRMVYEFESAAFNTPVGTISKPVRTSYGYHIIQVLDKRPARGEMRASHIMVVSNDKMNEDQRAKSKAKIYEIYDKLQSGGSFSNLANTFSDDRGSARVGGDLGWFGAGRMVPEFEEKAFALQADGDYSEPFLTQFGWHIVKRTGKRDLGSYEEEYDNLSKKVKQDKRSQGSQHSLVLKLIDLYNVKINKSMIEPFYTAVDSSYFTNKWTLPEGTYTKPVFTLKDKKYGNGKIVYTQADFAEYLKSNMRKRKATSIAFLVDSEFEKFVDEKMIAFERSILNQKYPEYRALVSEYHDGILLFEIMNKQVWSKATEDSAGLEEFFNAHREDYVWNQRLDVDMYMCNSAQVADSVEMMLKENATDSAITSTLNKSSQLAVQHRDGKFEPTQELALAEIPMEKGVYKAIVNSNVVVIKVNEVLEPTQKELSEVRGLATSAYQDYLEAKWLEELKNKYTYTVNEEALEAIQ